MIRWRTEAEMGPAAARETWRSASYLLLDRHGRADFVPNRISQDRGSRSFEKGQQGNAEARKVF